MTFAGMNYLAIILAAMAAWLAGAAWYGVLAKPWVAAQGKTIKPWVAAQGKTMEAFRTEQAARRGSPRALTPFIIAFIAELVMAWVIAGSLGHLGSGQVTMRNGIISAVILWLGLVATTMAVNYAFLARKPMLYAIDIGHWLMVLVIQGAIIGAIGV